MRTFILHACIENQLGPMKNITKVIDPTSQYPKGSSKQAKIITGQHTVKGL